VAHRDRRVADLLAALDHHEPRDALEADALRRAVALVRWLPRPFDETADPTHVTASAIVDDGAGSVLLHRHRRMGIWLQPGGHIEEAEEPAAAALREVHEETGIVVSHAATGPNLVHVDLHEGPRSHVHIDLRYALRASTSAGASPAPGESEAVAWFRVEEAIELADASLRRALRAHRALVSTEMGA
jgi:8-oxo-dGTP pyrophosphatase MutT (NUDIX family)